MNRRELLVTSATVVCACAASDALAKDPEEKQIDVGTLADYLSDGVKADRAKSHKFLVVRHEGKLYAPSAKCTHKSCTLRVKSGKIACPCHKSEFDPMGVPTGGPAKTALFRYGISVNDQGRVIIDKAKQFDEKKWEDEGAFVEVE